MRTDKDMINTYCNEYFEKTQEQERLISQQQTEVRCLPGACTSING